MFFLESVKWYKNCQPIAVIDNTVVVSRWGKLCLITDNKLSTVTDLGINLCERIEETVPLLRRLRRREVRCSCVLKNKNILFFRCGILYVYNAEKKILKKIWKVKRGYSTPLNITDCVNNVYIALWGDYFSNNFRESVNIYGLTTDYKVKTVYTFPPQTIRHIHNIIHDKSDGYFIFTGDDDEKAGIYHMDSIFTKIEPVYVGGRQARAVVGFTYKDGLIFATDSVDEVNHLYYLHVDNNEWVKDEISSINGSCINGTFFRGKYLFSTTVEPPESDGTIRSLFSRKLGTGILSDNIEIIMVNDKLQVKIAGRMKKDVLPYKLFQYGTVRFVDGNDSNLLCLYPVAVKRYDGMLGIIREV